MEVYIQFERKPLHFSRPVDIITCDSPATFASSFSRIESALDNGYYAAGFFSYEAGYCFEEKLNEEKSYGFPLFSMGIYGRPAYRKMGQPPSPSGEDLKNLRLNITRNRYFSDIETIRDYIRKGDVYQITYCIKLLFEYGGDPARLYLSLLKDQPVPYPAYIDSGRFKMLSLSPEKFIKKRDSHIVTKPMKGTWPRGRGPVTDTLERIRFQYDAKNRAENVMIADLLRNDLGRVGSRIRAPILFEVAGYNTLFQMTSTVTGRVDTRIPLRDLFASLFPSGSVTGAPKIRAMQIIRSLEREERRIYTGAIGYITPERDMFFNIPIRTILLDGKRAEMGIGGGIVWDSTPEGEWAEGLLKAKFVTKTCQIG
jgi:para-aminobenzoate synthetase/4-amino-4-deoxychorismate lyase